MQIKPRRKGGQVKKVLLAVDETDGSKSVLSVFQSMNPEPESAVLVHVNRPRRKAVFAISGKSVFTGITEPERQALNRESESILAFYRAELENSGFAGVKTVAAVGVPSDEILKLAGEENVDAVILGSNRRSALKLFTAGSVTREVELHATLPVLVANTAGRKNSIAYNWRGEVYAAH
jgi:nucleotide-binding universal stress UspA family protein